MDFVANTDERFDVCEKFKKWSHISDISDYERIYNLSIQVPNAFWLNIANQFYWQNDIQKDSIFSYNFDVHKGPIDVQFMKGCKTNACYNLIDRIIKSGLGERTAYIWIGNDLNQKKSITYNELKREICKFANVLKSQGIKTGDRVAIYLPVSIELVVAMLACARIGAVHTVVLMSDASDECEPVWLDGEDPLFILYTSGSTGKPKGVVHTIAGYMLTTALVFKYAFNYKDGDIFFCTADLGWITGHTANVYGPLANGATAVLFDGIPTHPSADRFWRIIDENKVNAFYTAPTAIRTLMKFGDDLVTKYEMSEL
ncbi:unnamed protein product, partial [Medioppia subpectinata]